MHRLIMLSFALFVSLTLNTFAAETVRPAESGAEAHAPQGATPGSYEDWCSEHGVPDSQCSRCDKSLIPAFKATGDWCSKHGLPQSQCKKCDPDLEIVRPPMGR